MRHAPLLLLAMLLTSALPAKNGLASDIDEFKIKRQETYEFTEKPTVTRKGDRIEIAFASKAFCDVTVAIENEEGQIIRHLASGVLGPNAPEPFQKDSLRQAIVWDSKADRGDYVIDKDRLTARVSLGLRPQFEKTLYWHAKRRNGAGRNPLICPQPEGVYVYEGDGVEQIRLFDHDGNYVRTVYPFAADGIGEVRGLGWLTMPDGFKSPEKIGYWYSTFLLGGLSRTDTGPGDSGHGFTVHDKRIAMLAEKLTRLTADGSPADFDIYGPQVTQQPENARFREGFRPKSAAFSPDGRWLYMTGYYQNTEERIYGAYGANILWNHGVYRMEFPADKPPELWAGKRDRGSDDASFNMPTSLAVDGQGNVYVADNRNNRVQVFDPSARLVRTIKVDGPAIVQVDQAGDQLYVFSWAMTGRQHDTSRVKAELRIFGPLKAPALRAECPLPLHNYRDSGAAGRGDEVPYRAAIDTWAKPAVVWLCTSADHRASAEHRNIQLYTLADGKLELKSVWQNEVVQSVARWRSASMGRQRLYVNPKDGALYVGEGDSGVGKAFNQVVKIDPDTGRCRLVDLPMGSEEMAFDSEGQCYLRTTEVIARYNPITWREIPFDYGEERKAAFASGCRGADLQGGLYLPSQKPVYWHQQGMDVNFKGDIAVFCCNRKETWRARDGRSTADIPGKPYVPSLYPGRYTYGELHIFDKHGKPRLQDIVQGVPDGHGTCMDANGDVYLLIRGPRLLDGKTLFGENTGTIIKFKSGKGRLVATDRTTVPLDKQSRPQGPPQLRLGYLGNVWVQDYEWMYSGIGLCRPGPCQCWNCRFVVDYFGRSFAPENLRSQFAVLDTNGNLITRIGRYGNVDDGRPLVDEPGGPATRAIGGDEVALMYANFVATKTDRRVYLADPGNLRIVCVKLGYYAEERAPLKTGPGAG